MLAILIKLCYNCVLTLNKDKMGTGIGLTQRVELGVFALGLAALGTGCVASTTTYGVQNQPAENVTTTVPGAFSTPQATQAPEAPEATTEMFPKVPQTALQFNFGIDPNYIITPNGEITCTNLEFLAKQRQRIKDYYEFANLTPTMSYSRFVSDGFPVIEYPSETDEEYSHNFRTIGEFMRVLGSFLTINFSYDIEQLFYGNFEKMTNIIIVPAVGYTDVTGEELIYGLSPTGKTVYGSPTNGATISFDTESNTYFILLNTAIGKEDSDGIIKGPLAGNNPDQVQQSYIIYALGQIFVRQLMTTQVDQPEITQSQTQQLKDVILYYNDILNLGIDPNYLDEEKMYNFLVDILLHLYFADPAGSQRAENRIIFDPFIHIKAQASILPPVIASIEDFPDQTL